MRLALLLSLSPQPFVVATREIVGRGAGRGYDVRVRRGHARTCDQPCDRLGDLEGAAVNVKLVVFQDTSSLTLFVENNASLTSFELPVLHTIGGGIDIVGQPALTSPPRISFDFHKSCDI